MFGTGRHVLLNGDFIRLLACPFDHGPLAISESTLACPSGHRFPVEDGIAVFTDHPRRETTPGDMEPCHFDSAPTPVDPFVNDWVMNTNGNLYRRARGKLTRYPIPKWSFPASDGGLLIDLGCGWGRWSVAASRAGFRTLGIDLHLDALMAARRVSRQLGVDAGFVCAEVDALPLESGCADFVFSYSVLQHLERDKVRGVFREVSRVLKRGATCFVQLPNRFGAASLLRQARRGFRDGRPGTFDMRYWSRAQIASAVGDAGLRLVSIRADGFLSQNPQLSDLDLLPGWGKAVVLTSHAGCRASALFPRSGLLPTAFGSRRKRPAAPDAARTGRLREG